MSPQAPTPEPISKDNACPIHTVLNEVCGGPHRVVRTDLGDELLGPSEEPIGTPASEMSETERLAHMEAEAAAQREEPTE